jgi:hypothetical protein
MQPWARFSPPSITIGRSLSCRWLHRPRRSSPAPPTEALSCLLTLCHSYLFASERVRNDWASIILTDLVRLQVLC